MYDQNMLRCTTPVKASTDCISFVGFVKNLKELSRLKVCLYIHVLATQFHYIPFHSLA